MGGWCVVGVVGVWVWVGVWVVGVVVGWCCVGCCDFLGRGLGGCCCSAFFWVGLGCRSVVPGVLGSLAFGGGRGLQRAGLL
ncbi:hypothetical protein, partial [Pseudomonas syringae group genomosp. 7]|uniref:hypothetical protein n=1 Tax=Pseudomonas syringae group genomosp. 7 TaxID=251699 RepID=UPI00377044D7